MRVFGGGGARLRYLDNTTFRDTWVDTIVGWRPTFVLVWLGANDLNSTAQYDEDHWRHSSQLHTQLLNELRSQLGPFGMQLIIMPIIPHTDLRHGMSPNDFF